MLFSRGGRIGKTEGDQFHLAVLGLSEMEALSWRFPGVPIPHPPLTTVSTIFPRGIMLYHVSMKAQFTIGVFGMVFDENNRILLCHRRDHDLWNLPGGALEEAEAPWDGVKREVKEETGLEADVSKLVGVYSKEGKNDIVFSFVCEIVGGEIVLSDEADKIEYFDIATLPSNTVPKQVERIKDFLTNPDALTLKVQTGKSTTELLKEGKL